MAENHPVGFQWVVEAREKGAKIIHVDPRYTRTSAMADIWVPLRAGSDIIFLGAMVNYVLQNHREFREYVESYTNASTILREEFRSPEDLDGFFSGWDPEKAQYDPQSWLYEGSPSKERESGEKPGHSPAGGGHAKDRGGEAQDTSHFKTDPTLQHPRCVFQVLKRHFARYTPALVERYCGVPQEVFLKTAETFASASGTDKTAAICYAVAGPSIPRECRSSARRPFCNYCSEISVARAEEFWPCADTLRFRDRPTFPPCMTFCRDISRCRSSKQTRTG